jgi:hypothetical protein
MNTRLFLFLIAAVAAPRLTAQPNSLYSITPKTYLCNRTEKPLEIDGALTEPAWQKAEWTEAFVDIEGSLKPAPRLRTRAKMLWDDRYLYVAAELEEPDIWGTLTQRDAVIFHDNDFEVFIDPDGDTHQYYEMEMNALNTVWDLLLVKPYRDGGPPVNGWDIHGLKTAVLVHGTLNQPGDIDTSWSVEIALPWDALRECAHRDAPPRDGDRWRMNFSRVEWRATAHGMTYSKLLEEKTGKPLPEDNWVWSPQGLINMHYPEMWGFVQFSSAPPGSPPAPMVMPPEEEVKRVLRQIYYREKEYFAQKHAFAPLLALLRLEKLTVKNFVVSPSIEVTTSSFEAVASSDDGSVRWHIDQDGRTWSDLVPGTKDAGK